MIRPATHADLEMLAAFGAAQHAMSGVAAPFDRGAFSDFAGFLIDSDTATVLVSQRGMIGGVLFPAYCAADWRMAVELFWWAEDGQGLRLLSGFEQWAREHGAREVRMTTLASHERAALALQRRGYVPTETSHARVI